VLKDEAQHAKELTTFRVAHPLDEIVISSRAISALPLIFIRISS